MKISGISGAGYTPQTESQATWTYQQVAQLKNFVKQGLPLNLIAQKLNSTTAAVQREAAILGLKLNTK